MRLPDIVLEASAKDLFENTAGEPCSAKVVRNKELAEDGYECELRLSYDGEDVRLGLTDDEMRMGLDALIAAKLVPLVQQLYNRVR